MRKAHRSGKPFFGQLKNFQLIDLNFDDHDDAELMDQLIGHGADHDSGSQALFLGSYSKAQLLAFLDKGGIIDQLERKGFSAPILTMDTSDPLVHRLWIYAHGPNGASHQIGEIILRRATLSIQNFRSFLTRDAYTQAHEFMELSLDFQLDMLVIEWLCMQDPTKRFSDERPQLPGQEHPGLGVGRPVQQLLMTLAERKHRDGILNIPEYFHNAYLYSPPFIFCNPRFEGLFRTIMTDLEPEVKAHGLARVATAVHHGYLFDKMIGAFFEWTPEELIAPLSSRLKSYYSSDRYNELVDEATTNGRFHIDWAAYEAADDGQTDT